jgi:hypothetical protein
MSRPQCPDFPPPVRTAPSRWELSGTGQTPWIAGIAFQGEPRASGVVRHVPYRMYSVTRRGHIESPPVIIDCDDERAAIERAKAIKNGSDLDVWEGKRRVALLRGEADA